MASPSPTPPSLSPTPHPGLHPHQSSSSYPPAAPQSKRDKRRHALSEKLLTLTDGFHNPSNPRSRDQHYRAQLVSLQADMQLVTKCDVSGHNLRMLNDSGEAIMTEVKEVLEGMGLGDLVTNGDKVKGQEAEAVGVEGMAGKWYSNFVEAVNESIEERDTQLALLHDQHQKKSAYLLATHRGSLIHAREEHKYLASTIQSRLQARLKGQLKKLTVEKETCSSSAKDSSLASLSSITSITESNALLLHPSQYGIVPGIGSPRRGGGADDDMEKEGGRRKPRRRAGEVEELLAFGVGVNFDLPSNNKRKRSARSIGAAHHHNAPSNEKAPDVENLTPIADATSPSESVSNSTYEISGGGEAPAVADRELKRRKHSELIKQIYTPIYSVEKLFTEKELQLANYQAQLAAVRYFTERPQEPYTDGDSDHDRDDDPAAPDPPGTGANTPLPENGLAQDDSNGDNTLADTADEEPPRRGDRTHSPLPALPAVPPTYSVNTRSNPPRHNTNGNNGNNSNGSSNAEFDRLDRLVYGSLPFGVTFVNSKGIAPPPPPLRSDEAENDLAAMRKPYAGGSGGNSGSSAEGGRREDVGLGLLGIAAEGMGRSDSRQSNDKRTASTAGMTSGEPGKKVRRG